MIASQPFTISAMTAVDLTAVIAIELQNPGPWNKTQLADELAHPASWQWLARTPHSATVAGYIVGRTVAGEAEILRLAVDINYRRHGIAQKLLEHTFTELCRDAVDSCFLEMRAGNTAARLLYEKNGFQSIGIRYNYYNGPVEDAVVMIKSLPQ